MNVKLDLTKWKSWLTIQGFPLASGRRLRALYNYLYAWLMQVNPSERRSDVSRAEPTTRQVVDSVMHAVLSIGRLMRQHATGDPLEPATFWLLKNLAEGSMRITDLAACSHLDTSTVSRHLSQLERTALIERSPDPQDGRAQRVGLSAAGRDRLQAAMDRRRDLLIHSFEGWPTDEIDEFDRLLSRFVDGIEHLTTELQPA